MRVLFTKELHAFWRKHPDSKNALTAWVSEVKRAAWDMPSQVTELYRRASVIPNNRVVFRIKGNHYRLVVQIDYQRKEVYILFLGTHAEYDRIDATKV